LAVVFFEVAAEPGVVVANPSDGFLEVMVAVFEAFDQDVVGEGEGRREAN